MAAHEESPRRPDPSSVDRWHNMCPVRPQHKSVFPADPWLWQPAAAAWVWGAPNLPFVIAAMGQNGSKPAAGAMLAVCEVQMSMNDVPEFKGNVKAFPTDVLVDTAAEAVYPNWRKDIEKWKTVGGDFAFHYMGNAIWFTRIGHAMGESMIELMPRK